MKKNVLIMVFVAFSIGLLKSNSYSTTFYEITRSTIGNTTLSTIRTLVRREIDDPTNSYGTNTYSNSYLDDYINISHRDIVYNTQCLHAKATGYLVAGTTEYDLPTNLIAIERVRYNDDILPEKDIYAFDEDNSSWFTADVSSPTAYYKFEGIHKIGFYPCPKYSGGLTTLWYTKYPDILDDDTDEIFDSDPKLEPFRRAIVCLASYYILFQEQNPKSETLYREYQAYLKSIKDNYNLRPNYRPEMRTRY